MKDNRHPDRLLDDLTDEVVAPGFRAALLGRALGEVRRRRKVRRVRRAGLLLTLGIACFLGLWHGIPFRQAGSTEVACEIVRTRALSPQHIIGTKTSVATISSTTPGLVSWITTAAAERSFKEFSDAELLEFLSGKPVVLVSAAPRNAELVFLNPADAGGFEVR